MTITVLDGPLGTVLIERGHPAPAPAWSATHLREAPDSVLQLHKDYASAGASHHTTNTFRTRPADVGNDWRHLAEKAVQLTRSAIPTHHRVMGSIAPLADCYRPDLSPPNPGSRHRELADVLSGCGVDILLCETFPHIAEGLAAAEAALQTGKETWLSFTAGPQNDLLSPKAMGQGAAAAAAMGVSAILVNCIPATSAHPYIDAISGYGIPFGVYANAGSKANGVGWGNGQDGANRYAELAFKWAEQGATLIGSCCGTSPLHIQALSKTFADKS